MRLYTEAFNDKRAATKFINYTIEEFNNLPDKLKERVLRCLGV